MGADGAQPGHLHGTRAVHHQRGVLHRVHDQLEPESAAQAVSDQSRGGWQDRRARSQLGRRFPEVPRPEAVCSASRHRHQRQWQLYVVTVHGHDDHHQLQSDEQRLYESRQSGIRRRAVRSGPHAPRDVDRGLRGAGSRQRCTSGARLALAGDRHSQRAQRGPAQHHQRPRQRVFGHQPSASEQSQRRFLR